MRSCQSGWAAATGRQRGDQQVEALLRVEPARGDRDLALGSRALAGQRRHRVGQPHDLRRAVEHRRVVAAVLLGQHREGVEPAVAAPEVAREPSPVGVEVHVLLRDGDRARAAERGGSRLKLGRVPIDDPAAHRAQAPGQQHVGPQAAPRVGEVVGVHEQARRAGPRARRRCAGRRPPIPPPRRGTGRTAASRRRTTLTTSTERPRSTSDSRQAHRGPHRPAHPPRVQQQDPHVAAVGLPAPAPAARRREPQREPVQRDRGRAKHAAREPRPGVLVERLGGRGLPASAAWRERTETLFSTV